MQPHLRYVGPTKALPAWANKNSFQLFSYMLIKHIPWPKGMQIQMEARKNYYLLLMLISNFYCTDSDVCWTCMITVEIVNAVQFHSLRNQWI